MRSNASLIATERIQQLIFIVRGQKVMLDSDLAHLYGVETKVLIQAVKRNADRFPSDFLFRMNSKEFHILRSQSVTSKKRGGRQYFPYVFTEQGVAMLSSVLHSKRAVLMNIEIMRAFVGLRRLLQSHEELASKLADLETKFLEHDEKLSEVFEAIRQLMEPDVPKNKRRIGFDLQNT